MRVRKIAFRIKITVCPSMGLRPTAAKAFQLHPEASGPQHPVVHLNNKSSLHAYMLFVVQ